ncbi:hypothetical protein BDD43_3985 [Mucilaginibacter gracilis]|uniref:Uncharacterized protein n=1 Tax=Mucilaginibacter gracilis TaxID=423350 RepID=A0A495J4Y3_9SPHI|nr:hypothetical protein [Mucilaginibacter gracilis]RKR83771.1 hypothetical protein BDD43_3985 [Mucilaginibacter gracilis]
MEEQVAPVFYAVIVHKTLKFNALLLKYQEIELNYLQLFNIEPKFLLFSQINVAIIAFYSVFKAIIAFTDQ